MKTADKLKIKSGRTKSERGRSVLANLTERKAKGTKEALGASPRQTKTHVFMVVARV